MSSESDKTPKEKNQRQILKPSFEPSKPNLSTIKPNSFSSFRFWRSQDRNKQQLQLQGDCPEEKFGYDGASLEQGQDSYKEQDRWRGQQEVDIRVRARGETIDWSEKGEAKYFTSGWIAMDQVLQERPFPLVQKCAAFAKQTNYARKRH